MNPAHILLVEDNEGDILLTKEALNEANSNTTLSVIRDGWEAIQFLDKKEKYSSENTPDIILLDINLPKMNGHEVIKYIKSSETLKHIPVIVLTTSTSPTDVAECYHNLANCFITKPVDLNDFLKAIALIESFWISLVQLPGRIKI